ncbi:DegT/DnrJ/EryC1/StrS family aminotransferase [Belliella sp. R4-6]|uniref:DegT/DnrJ/EryC1/StrS family aminotransferase n=1 Tax=Belliella alkalica TaxID=1730871 RepID=A0ABS9VFZ4_9BACT|nr:DegT/DnrJ/EryC1/StrS family aminotransferase [Belliella alkalica]MCH7415369.1 DegT/DnrJ/EryC1/StrS family aminotransferase [Belliella alkalica]
MKSKIPFLDLKQFPDHLKDELKEKFSELLDKGVFSGSEEVIRFEQKLSQLLGAPFVISCSNGTDALELALRALGIGQNDEVIIPAMSWVSTAEAVILVGAKPIFIDTDTSGLIDLEILDLSFTSKTKAIIPVHLYGKMVNMKKLVKWAESKGIFVIEDAAQAFGTFQIGISAGLHGDIGCFSFYPSKNLGALGEAGALITKDAKLAEKLKILRNHGQEVRDHHVTIGRNARIDTIQAGFLNVILNYFKEWQSTRKSLSKIYVDNLKNIDWIKLPDGTDLSDHNLHLFVIRTKFRNELREHMFQNGVETSIHYPTAIPQLSPYHSKKEFPESETLAKEVISLPMNPFLSEETVKKICEVIKSYKPDIPFAEKN